MLKYRAEIDGLRAIAVIPVILFHAGFELFSGGFIGVDVFFVISGYLITTIIIKDLENNSFNLVNFYERRARRILPALYFMIVVSIIFGWFILTPYFYRDLFQTITATSLFISNYLIYLKSGYFAPIGELKPFLHTWSLAVEEQFYVIFPILLLLFWRFVRVGTVWLLFILLISSFLFCLWALSHHPNANFLLLPSRAWELLAGCLVAFFIQKKGLLSNNFFATLGLVAILFSVFVFDSSTPFPSYYTLIPVLGTIAIIIFANEKTLVAQILRIRIIVGLGLISYSLYLWHQPVFSFLKHLLFTKPTYFQNFNAFVLILLLSIFSWHYIERPFRNKKKFNKKNIIIFSILIIVSTALLGFLGHKKMGFTNRLSFETQVISEGSFDKNPRQFACNYLDKKNIIDKLCLLGDKENTEPTIALIGDSHADHLVESLHNQLLFEGLTAYNFSFKNCSPVNFISNTSNFTENICFEKISDFLKDNKNISKVIASFRWVSSIPGKSYGNYATQNLLDKETLEARGEIIAKKIENLAESEVNLTLVYPVPEAGEDVPNYTVKKRMLGEKNFILRIPYTLFMERNKHAYYALNLVSTTKETVRVYPAQILCEEMPDGYCKTVFNGKSLYYDDDHLSNYGASLLAPFLLN
jgi:peptidoglycan/LPS O-acetylase OafA/YrhL